MNRKDLKRILEEIVTGKELVPLFVDSGLAPSVLYWALKELQQAPDMALIQRIASKKRVSSHYVLDRIGSLVDQIDDFRASNPYSTLNVTYQADLSRIRQNWKSLLKEWHPDKTSESADSVEMAQRINEAFRTLKEPEQRKQYDKQYAPLLAIVKDIEEQPRPSFHWAQPRRVPSRKFTLIGAALLTAGGFLWYLSPSPPAPVRTTVKRRAKPFPSIPAVKKVGPSHASSSQKSRAGLPKGLSPHSLPTSFRFNIRTWGKSGNGIQGLPQRSVFDSNGDPRAAFQVSGKGEAVRGGQARGGFRFRGRKPVSPVIAKAAVFPTFRQEKSHAQRVISCSICEDVKEKPKISHLPLRKSSLSPGMFLHKGAPETHASQTTRTKALSSLSPAEKVVKNYIAFYREGNYPGLFLLFDSRAKENGIPIRESLENYKVFLRHLKVVRFDLRETTAHQAGNRYFYTGQYTLEYKKPTSQARFRREGRISFILIREKSRWLIQELNYFSN